MVSSDDTNSTRRETDPESQCEAEDVVSENMPQASNKGPNGPQIRKLSTISRMYDVNGDGQLDPAESAMRDMDSSNRGYLTNEKVLKMMEHQIQTQKQLFKMKRIMLVLLALVVILALSNLGTSFAAAALAKDTSTSTEAQFIDKDTKEELSTQSSAELIDVERGTVDENGRRRLCSRDGPDGELDCETDGQSFPITMDKNACKKMQKQCRKGNTVRLMRAWPNNGIDTMVQLCPPQSGTLSRNDRSLLVAANGLDAIIEPLAGGHCAISGPAVEQKIGEICAEVADCGGSDSGMECRESPKQVGSCQGRCAMKRWGLSLMKKCQSECVHKSCQAMDAEAE